MKNRTVILLFASAFLFTSCQAVFKAFVGFKPMERFDPGKYEAFVDNLPKDVPFTSIVSSVEQSLAVIEFDTAKQAQHNLYQPIQMLYFRGGELVSYHVNCMAPAKGFGLNWNYDGRFETFPPKSPLNCDSINISLAQYQRVYPEINGDGEYTIIVYWTNVLPKISRSAIKTVFANLKEFQQVGNCQVYLFNDDQFLIDNMKEESSSNN